MIWNRHTEKQNIKKEGDWTELIKAHKCKMQTEIGVWNFCIQLITNEDIPNDKVTFKKCFT